MVWAVKVVSLRDVHLAQTCRFPLDRSRLRDASSALIQRFDFRPREAGAQTGCT
jgi:hypothetical protein